MVIGTQQNGQHLNSNPKVIVCIPAYNEEKTIAAVITKAKKYADQVIVCDDGSNDMTGEISTALGATVLRHERKLGKGAALRTLFLYASQGNSDLTVTLDADMQHDPDQIPNLINALESQKADIVIGSRFLESSVIVGAPKYRMIGNSILSKASNTGVNDTQSGFRVYRTVVLKSLTPTESGYSVDTEILLRANENGLKILEIPTVTRYDVPKPSKGNPLFHGIDAMLGIVKYYSIKRPLFFFGLPGLTSSFMALFFWIWTLHEFAITRQVVTSLALIAIATTTVGLVMTTTAIMLWVIISAIRESKVA